MDCNKAEKLLVGYLYQELSPSETVRIEKHLDGCPRCTRTLENWRAIHLGFQRTVEDPPAAPYLKEKILASAKQELNRKNTFFENLSFFLKPALILPVMLFAGLAVLLVFQKQTDMAQAPVPQPAAVQESVPAEKLDPQREEDLRSLGYVGGAEEADSRAKESAPRKRLQEQEGRELSDTLKLQKLEKKSDDTSDSYASKTEPSGKDQPAPASEYNEEQESTAILPEVSQQPAETEPAPPAAPKPVSPSDEGRRLGMANTAFHQAQMSFKRNDLNKGKAEAEQAIHQDKTGSLAAEFHEAGKQYQLNKEPEQAIIQYNLVLNNYPNYEQSPDVILRLAEAYEQIGAYDKALYSYQRLRQYPDLKNTAEQKIGEMMRKQKAQEQLRSLGYVDKQ